MPPVVEPQSPNHWATRKVPNTINLFFLILCIYSCLAVLGLRCRTRAFSSHGKCGLLSRCHLQASHYGGFSDCGAQALGHGLSHCGTWPLLPCDMRDLPGPRIEPTSSAFAGGFLTTGPPRKSRQHYQSYQYYDAIFPEGGRQEVEVMDVGELHLHLPAWEVEMKSIT